MFGFHKTGHRFFAKTQAVLPGKVRARHSKIQGKQNEKPVSFFGDRGVPQKGGCP